MKRSEFASILKKEILVLDGAYGTEFFKMGYGNIPGEILNLKAPEIVEKLQRSYVEAGSDIILANTFSANRYKLRTMGYENEIQIINETAVKIARRAGNSNTLVFGDLSSTGDFPKPMGELTMDQSIEIFKEQAQILLNTGVDGFIIETMSDIKELKAAVLGVRAVTQELPLIAHMTFDETLRCVTGSSVRIFASLFEDLDVDVLGINCSLGPKESLAVFKELSSYTTKFLSIEPNAGKPEYNGKLLTYKTKPEDFAIYVEDFIELGANIIGGCCGTTKEHIKLVHHFAKQRKPVKRTTKPPQALTSRTEYHEFLPFTTIGERINPASRNKFQEELVEGDFSRVIRDALDQTKEGAHVLDLNLGIEKLLTKDHFKNVINELDKQSSLPLSMDIQMPKFLAPALREYAGRPLINSARVTEKNLMRRINYLKKYGGMLILLAMGKSIDETAKGRVEQFMEGVKMVEESGLSRDRIVADPLVLSFGAGKNPFVTLEIIDILTKEGIKTTMGLSNLSFGMPNRSYLNGAFVAQSIGVGLSSAIMNPGDTFTMNSLKAALSLRGDEMEKSKTIVTDNPLVELLLSGDVDAILKQIKLHLQTLPPVQVSQEILGKAMEEVGTLYGKGKIYLPNLLLSAETSKPVFDYINSLAGETVVKKGKVLLATVEGDVHDIGKKIIGTVLKTAGFDVVDVGKDVTGEEIIQATKKHTPDILGLSAMMTTTVGKVEEVHELLQACNCKVKLISGGASMNKKLAMQFGCDGYAPNASTVSSLCEELIAKK
jgi:5-methyltetrahydrofolate--homocysteine methyltransferase